MEVPAEALPLSPEDLTAHVARVLDLVGFEGRLSLAVVDDEQMQQLNRDHHDTDAPTDVLAFPLDAGPPELGPAADEGFAAEVVVSSDTARRVAAERGVEPAAELMLYVVHGILHLVGEDDHDPEDARRMHLRTLGILEELGLQNVIELPAVPPNPAEPRRGP